MQHFSDINVGNIWGEIFVVGWNNKLLSLRMTCFLKNTIVTCYYGLTIPKYIALIFTDNAEAIVPNLVSITVWQWNISNYCTSTVIWVVKMLLFSWTKIKYWVAWRAHSWKTCQKAALEMHTVGNISLHHTTSIIYHSKLSKTQHTVRAGKQWRSQILRKKKDEWKLSVFTMLSIREKAEAMLQWRPVC